MTEKLTIEQLRDAAAVGIVAANLVVQGYLRDRARKLRIDAERDRISAHAGPDAEMRGAYRYRAEVNDSWARAYESAAEGIATLRIQHAMDDPTPVELRPKLRAIVEAGIAEMEREIEATDRGGPS